MYKRQNKLQYEAKFFGQFFWLLLPYDDDSASPFFAYVRYVLQLVIRSLLYLRTNFTLTYVTTDIGQYDTVLYVRTRDHTQDGSALLGHSVPYCILCRHKPPTNQPTLTSIFGRDQSVPRVQNKTFVLFCPMYTLLVVYVDLHELSCCFRVLGFLVVLGARFPEYVVYVRMSV